MKNLLATLSFVVLLFGVQSLIAQDKESEKIISGGVLNGNAISLPAPEYPAAARAVEASGVVKVAITINKKGSVESAKILSGHPLLRQESLKAAKTATFEPTLLKEKPVRVRGIIVYYFGPKNKTKSTTPRYFDRDILNSRALKLPAPEVSEETQKRCISGYVEVKVSLDSDGNVISAKALKGHPLLRAASENAAKKSRFKTKETSGTIIYNFDFSDECEK